MNNGKNQRTSIFSLNRSVREKGQDVRNKADRRKRAFQPMLDDSLEKRQLLAVSAVVNGTVLDVNLGTDFDIVEFRYATTDNTVTVYQKVGSVYTPVPFSGGYNAINITTNINNNASAGQILQPSMIFAGNEPISGSYGISLNSLTYTGNVSSFLTLSQPIVIGSNSNLFPTDKVATVTVNGSNSPTSSGLLAQAVQMASTGATINVGAGNFAGNIVLSRPITFARSATSSLGDSIIRVASGGFAFRQTNGNLTFANLVPPSPATTQIFQIAPEANATNTTGIILASGSNSTYINTGNMVLSTDLTTAVETQSTSELLLSNTSTTLSNVLISGGSATITNSQTLTGNVTVTSGTFNNNGTLTGTLAQSGGASTLNGSVTVANLTGGNLTSNSTIGTLAVSGGNGTLLSAAVVSSTVNVSGTGTLVSAGQLAQVNTSGSASFTNSNVVTGPVNANGGTLLNTGTLANLTVGGAAATNNGTVTGPVAVTAGSLTLNQSSTQTGNFTVSGGTLTANAAFGGNLTQTGGVVAVQSAGSAVGPVYANGGSTTIAVGGQVANLSVSGGSVVNSGTITGASTSVASGNLTLANGSTQAGSFTVSGGALTANALIGGTLAVSAGSATVQGSGSVVGQTTVSSTGLLTSNGALGALVVNGGEANLTGGTAASLSQSDGTVTNAGNITGTASLTGGNTTVTAAGIVSGATTVNGGNLTSAGSLQALTVTTGQANLTGGTAASLSQSGGTVTNAGNITGTASLTGGNTTVTAAGIVSGATTVNGGNLTSAGSLQALTVTTGQANLTGGTAANLTQNGGTVINSGNITGAANLNSGTTTVTAAGIVSGATTVNGGNLTSAGTLQAIDVQSGQANLTGGTATSLTQSGGTATSAANITGTASLTGGNTTITGTVGGTTTVSISGNLTSTGTLQAVDVQGGRANLSGGTATNATVSGGTLVISGAAVSGTLGVSATGTANVTGGSVAGATTTAATLNQTGGDLADLTIDAGTSTLTGGNVTGVVTVNAGTIATSGSSNLSNTINVNNGTATFAGTQAGPLNVNGSAADVAINSPITGLTTVTLSNSTAINSGTGALLINGDNANVTFGGGTYAVGATTLDSNYSLTVPVGTTLASFNQTLNAVSATTNLLGNVSGSADVYNGTLNVNGTIGGDLTAHYTAPDGIAGIYVNTGALVSGNVTAYGAGSAGGSFVIVNGATIGGDLTADAGSASLFSSNVTGSVFALNSGSINTDNAVIGGNATIDSSYSSLLWLANGSSLAGNANVTGGALTVTGNSTVATLTQSGASSAFTSIGDLAFSRAVDSSSITGSASVSAGTLVNAGTVNNLTVSGDGFVTNSYGFDTNATIGGRLLGPVFVNGGNLTLEQGTVQTGAFTVTDGTLTSNATFAADGLSQSGGVVAVQSGANLVGSATVSNGTLTNDGIVNGALSVSGGSVTNNVTLASTVNISGTGSLTLTNGSNQTGAFTVSGGTLTANAAFGGSLDQTGGAVEVQSAGIAIGPVTANGGTLAIDALGQVANLSVGGGTVTNCGTITGATVAITSGNLTLVNGSTQLGNFTVSGGTLTSNSTFGGNLTQSGGVVTVQNGGNLTGVASVSNGTLTNDGVITGVLNVSATGNVTNNANLASSVNVSGGNLTLTNGSVQTGAFTVSGGTLTANSAFGGTLVQTNGAVVVQVAGNAVGPVSANGGTLDNYGVVNDLSVNGGTVTTYNTTVNDVTVGSGSLALVNGSTQAGNFTVSGGALTANAVIGGTLGVSGGSATVQASGAVNGTTTVSNTGNLTSNGTLQALVVTGGQANLTGGTATALTQTNGAITTAANITGPVNANGGTLLNQSSGTLANLTVAGGAVTNNGVITSDVIVSSGSLDLNPSSTQLGNFTVSGGTVTGLILNGATLSMSGGILNSLQINSGTAGITGGNVNGTLTTNGTVNVNTTGTVANLTVNTGTTTIGSGGTVTGTINALGGTTTLGGTQSGALNVNGATADVAINTAVAGLTTVTLSNSTTISTSTGALTINGAGANVTIGSGVYSIGATTVSASTLTVPATTTLASLDQSNGTVNLQGTVSGTAAISGGTLTTNGTITGVTTQTGGTTNITGGTYTGGIVLNGGTLITNNGQNFTGSINASGAVAGTTLVLPLTGTVNQSGNLTLGTNLATQVAMQGTGGAGYNMAVGKLVSSGTVALAGSVTLPVFNLNGSTFPNRTDSFSFITGNSVSGAFVPANTSYLQSINFDVNSNGSAAYLTNASVSAIYISGSITPTGYGNATYLHVEGVAGNVTAIDGLTAFANLSSFNAQSASYAGADLTVYLGNGTYTGSLLANLSNTNIFLRNITDTTDTPANGSTSVTLDGMLLDSNDNLNFRLFGDGTADNYTALGTITMGGANITLSNGDNLAGVTDFTAYKLINNAANVTGPFGNFANGVEQSVSTVASNKALYNFQSYGNATTRDVAVVLAPSRGNLTAVYANDDWTGANSSGTVLTSPAGAVVGLNAYNTLAGATGAVLSPGIAGNATLSLYSGTYAESLNLSGYTTTANLTVQLVPDAGSYATVNLQNLSLGSQTTVVFDADGTTAANAVGVSDTFAANGTVSLGSAALVFTPTSTPTEYASYELISNANTTNAVSGSFAGVTFGQVNSIGGTSYYASSQFGADQNDVGLIRLNNAPIGNQTQSWVNSSYTGNGTRYQLYNGDYIYAGVNAYPTVQGGVNSLANGTGSQLNIANASYAESVTVATTFAANVTTSNGSSNPSGTVTISSLTLNSAASPNLWQSTITAGNVTLNSYNSGTTLGSYNPLALTNPSGLVNFTFGSNFTSNTGSLVVNRLDNGLTVEGAGYTVTANGTGSLLSFNPSANQSLTVNNLTLNQANTATALNANIAANVTGTLNLTNPTFRNYNTTNRVYTGSGLFSAGNLAQGSGNLILSITGSTTNDTFTMLGNLSVRSAGVTTNGALAYSGFNPVSATTPVFLTYNPNKLTSLVMSGVDGNDTFNIGKYGLNFAPSNQPNTSILGGAGDDSVVLYGCTTNSNATAVSLFDGGTGNDTLTTSMPQLYSDFQITGTNSGNLTVYSDGFFTAAASQTNVFTDVENLVGSLNNATTYYDRFVLANITPNLDGSPTSSIQSISGGTGYSTSNPSYDQLVVRVTDPAAMSGFANLSSYFAQWNIETLDPPVAVGNYQVSGSVQVFNNLTSGTISETAPIGSFLNLAKFYGGTQNDLFNISGSGTRGILVLDGGAGVNTLDMSEYQANVTVDLANLKATPVANSTAGSIANITNVFGTGGNDYLYGDSASNVLVGNGGNDTILGNAGNDILLGDYGADSLVGGAGNDFLTGDVVDFYYGTETNGVPASIMLDFLQSKWKTGTTTAAFDANSNFLDAPGTATTSLGVLTLKPLAGATLANGTINTNGPATIFSDNSADQIIDTTGYNSIVYTSGGSSQQPWITNDVVSSQTLSFARKRRYSRWV